MSNRQWEQYRLERLEAVLSQSETPLRAMEKIIWDDIEIAEVNEVFQRFRDFKSELDRIKQRHLT